MPASAADELWMRMGSRYGHTWASQYGTEPAGIAAAEWRSTLAGITPEQMRMGFEADAVRGDHWPPSSPSFRAMCLGIPSLPSVRAEIEDMVKWSHQGQGSIMSRFARGVWSRMNSYAYRNASGKHADRILVDAYRLTREFVMEGGTLPVDPVALVKHEKRQHVPASAETAQQHIDRLAEMLKTEPVKPYTEVE